MDRMSGIHVWNEWMTVSRPDPPHRVAKGGSAAGYVRLGLLTRILVYLLST